MANPAGFGASLFAPTTYLANGPFQRAPSPPPGLAGQALADWLNANPTPTSYFDPELPPGADVYKDRSGHWVYQPTSSAWYESPLLWAGLGTAGLAAFPAGIGGAASSVAPSVGTDVATWAPTDWAAGTGAASSVAPSVTSSVVGGGVNAAAKTAPSSLLKGLILGDAISGGVGLVNSLLQRGTSRDNLNAQIAENQKDRQFQQDRLNQILQYNTQQQQALQQLLFGSGTGGTGGGGLFGQLGATVAPYTQLGSNAATTLNKLMGFPSAPSAPPVAPQIAAAPALSVPNQPGYTRPPEGTPRAALTPLPGTTGATNPGNGMVELIAPTGQRKLVPRDQVAHYTALGATVA